MVRKVIVADDNPGVRRLVSSLLLECTPDVSITEVRDGTGIVEKLKSKNGDDYALVITDIQMVKMSGLEALLRVRELNRTTPIAIYSWMDKGENLSQYEPFTHEDSSKYQPFTLMRNPTAREIRNVAKKYLG